MWKTIGSETELQRFMEEMCCFHDSCIKEMHYLSGAYVNDDLSMFPLNNRRVLRIVIQRQCEKNSMVELEFQGLKELRLCPVDESDTCEILGSTMSLKNGDIYWCDCEAPCETDSGGCVLICAAALR